MLTGSGSAPVLTTENGLQIRDQRRGPSGGERAKLVIRPESLRLLTPGEAADNEAPGVVQEGCVYRRRVAPFRQTG